MSNNVQHKTDEELFASLISQRETKQALKKANAKNELSQDRLMRPTGSRFDDIKYKEVKFSSSSNKEDIISWIVTQNNGVSLLAEKCALEKKESASKLTVKMLKEVASQMRGELVMSKTTETLLDELLAECMTKQKKAQIETQATRWGNYYESFALDEYKRRLQEAHPEKNLVFKSQVFLKHKNNLFVGTTSDLLVFDADISLDTAWRVVENKCPFNSANHAKTLRLQAIDERYIKQCNGHLLTSGAQFLDFTSYDPRVKRDSHKLITITKEAQLIQEELALLERELLEFTRTYIREADSKGYDVRKELKISKKHFDALML